MMRQTKKVFIAGSRRISRLNKEAARRIDNIVDRGLQVLVGDANGADKAVQQYLASKHYPNVTVFCMDSGCRNNVGSWQTRVVRSDAHGFAYYSTKDRAMAEEAAYGFMLWDGKSRGTMTNIVDLVRQGKPVLVVIPSRRACFTLRESSDLEILGDASEIKRIDRELEPDHRTHYRKVTTALF
jgi:hypothetical protein